MTSKYKQQPLEFVREDDYVEYYLYPDFTDSSTKEDVEKVLEEINSMVKEYSKEYIWHKDSFDLRIKGTDGDHLLEQILQGEQKSSLDITKGPIFHGVTHYGDNIQDEWFIVAILLELTKRFNGLVGRVFDSDGEFLLIESANHLPNWVNPSKCDGKVFLYNGLVHICHDESLEAESSVSLDVNLAKIRTSNAKFCISNTAFACIQDRIRLFPDKVRDNQHTATIYVPLAVASILKHRPGLISHAVLAFCNRDPIDQKVLRAMRYFPPEERVYTSVRFTKCLYAMLIHNHFIPDRRTGWNLPSTKTAEHKAHLLGIKVACGFEILASQASKSKDLDTDKNWHRYLESLKDKNYFQGLMEGSKDYVFLRDKAESYYRVHCDTEKATTVIARDVLEMLRKVDQDRADLISAQKSLPEEDNDAWLNISSQELDEMLEKRYGQTSIIHKSPGEAGQSKSLSHILSEFLEQKSDYDGVDTETDQNLSEQSTSNKPKSKKKQKGNIEFNPDEFQSAMQNLLELVIPEDKWDSNSDMSDYDNDDDLEKNLEDMAMGNGLTSLDEYMEEMDRELASTTIGASFEKEPAAKKASVDDFDDIEDFQPVDIDANAVKNMMESYKAQLGKAGPASTLLGSLGLRLDAQKKGDEKNGELRDTTV